MSKFSNTLGGDRRGVSTVLGFVLIFGILVVSFSVYQAEVVPEQNEAVEFEHYQEIREQMTELRSNLVLMSESTSTRAVSVDLAARYPSRAIFVNPPPATGELRTVGTDDTEVNVTIENATAVDGETADFWNGSDVIYNTGTIEYDPDYNRQRGTPPLVYEQTLLHNNVEDGGQSVPLTGQSLVNDNRIKLITLDGSLRETSVGTESVDLEPVSTRSRVVGVENRGGPITIEFASRMGVSAWEETLANEMSAGHVEHIRSIEGGPDGFSILELVLEPGQRYQLELAKVGVGTGVTDTNESYITTVEEADPSMRTNTTQQFTVEVRDKFNNPQSNIDVTASASVGELRPSGEAGPFADPVTAPSRSDGRVTFLYRAAKNGSHQVNLTFSNTSGNVAGLSNETYVKQNITVGSGSDNNDSSRGGTTGDSALESGQAIIYESQNGTLMSLNGSGGERQTVGPSIDNARILGAPGDLTGDGETVLPYVDDSRNLKTVNSSGSIDTLVSGQGSGKSKPTNKNTPSLVGTGIWNGDSSVLYATQNKHIYQVDGSGTSTQVGKFNNNPKLVGVLGAGDINSDNENELLFTGTDSGNNNNGNNNNVVSYIESNGGNSMELTDDLGSGTAAGQPVETSGSTYVPIVDDDGDLELHTDDDDADNEEIEIELDNPDVAGDLPITSADVDDDGGIEIVYTNSSSALQYVDDSLSEDNAESKLLQDSDGNRIQTDGDIGVVSSYAGSGGNDDDDDDDDDDNGDDDDDDNGDDD